MKHKDNFEKTLTQFSSFYNENKATLTNGTYENILIGFDGLSFFINQGDVILNNEGEYYIPSITSNNSIDEARLAAEFIKNDSELSELFTDKTLLYYSDENEDYLITGANQ